MSGAKYSLETYKANFEKDGHKVNGDITAIDEADIPAHDVLSAGFHCQPFSIVGITKNNSLGRPHGFADETQGTLFLMLSGSFGTIAPRAFMFQNVKNLLSHDKGDTFRVITHALCELGYPPVDIAYQLPSNSSATSPKCRHGKGLPTSTSRSTPSPTVSSAGNINPGDCYLHKMGSNSF